MHLHRLFYPRFLHLVTNSKTAEIEQLKDTNQTLARELKDLRNAHQKEVRKPRLGQICRLTMHLRSK